ncbi:DUF2254 domain-containing protein [Puniceibacterium sp. IMCC21224]|uniref:DUF2254 domain-containing protein n=1 Tax=Puniceibacterium sp. IMCC21224 TaxID=1618204 RepID=UPI00064DC5EF|nr:DUF2254 domain-containing protein [Puniceibacterium sp. IMCC21224]KMK68765.1 hypothetical protein IMCC21224_113651 [Puniceibacterium sp. IMCC21224]
MLSRPFMLILRATRRLGVRVLFLSLLAVVAAVLAPQFDSLIPDALKDRFGQDAVLPILNILASSMLAVTTFSLGVMVSAFQAAQSQATPRAYRVLMQDTTTQTVLATFVSGFLFSLIALVMFQAELYDDAGAVVVFGLTLINILLIVVAILRWIDLLSQLGSMHHTLWMVEDAAHNSLSQHGRTPTLGARSINQADPPPQGAAPVRAPCSGHVQFIDVSKLHDRLEKEDARLWLTCQPGAYVLRGEVLGHVAGGPAELADEIRDHITFGAERTMEQDARFGVMVLSEIAVRALSPGVNDPGTAIDVIHRLQRLLWEYAADRDSQAEVRYPRIQLTCLTVADIVDDAYGVISRDSAGRIEVIRQVVQALLRLEQAKAADLASAARDARNYALAHGDAALSLDSDRAALRELAPRK